MTSPFGFTTEEGHAHLLSFPEYASTYLLVWSRELWEKFYESDTLNTLTGTSTGPPTLENYKSSIEKCRRVMANCSTYMIFDDHEVTDDWNLAKDMEDTILTNNLSRQIISNSIIAHLLCQAWGNDHEW